jgi:DNA-binding NtrC family response regulator
MPGMDGLACLKSIKEVRADTEVLIVTGYGTIPSAVEAMRLGAYDYIAKPFSFDELDQRLQRCMNARELRRENVHLRGLLRDKYHYENLVGRSEGMQRIFRLIRQVSQTRATVLLQGRSGTGKELVARAIHFNSPVAAGPMVTVDCGAIAPSVIESELFGHVKGAFTGAHQHKEGLFRIARGGTIFFDEVGELPLEMQTKLLRALQEREVRPVGSDRAFPVDVRVIAATHRNLQQLVKEGLFREDLFYRLNVIALEIPALHARKEDIPLLLAHFMRKHARPDRPVERVEARALHALLNYDWPGNIRELENVVERALALGSGSVVLEVDLPQQIVTAGRAVPMQGGNGGGGDQPDQAPARAEPISASESNFALRELDLSQMRSIGGLSDDAPMVPPAADGSEVLLGTALLNGNQTLDDIERQAIMATLRMTSGDRTATARILGIDKSTLYRKLKRYSIEMGAEAEASLEETVE